MKKNIEINYISKCDNCCWEGKSDELKAIPLNNDESVWPLCCPNCNSRRVWTLPEVVEVKE